jgi:hypothetical protein
MLPQRAIKACPKAPPQKRPKAAQKAIGWQRNCNDRIAAVISIAALIKIDCHAKQQERPASANRGKEGR